MKIQHLPMTCKPCDHVFTGEIVVEAPVEVAAASMLAVRCPRCGRGPKDIGIGGKASTPATSQPANHHQQASGEP